MRASFSFVGDEVESTGAVLAEETVRVGTMEAGREEDVTGTVELAVVLGVDSTTTGVVACKEELDAGAAAVAWAAWWRAARWLFFFFSDGPRWRGCRGGEV